MDTKTIIRFQSPINSHNPRQRPMSHSFTIGLVYEMKNTSKDRYSTKQRAYGEDNKFYA